MKRTAILIFLSLISVFAKGNQGTDIQTASSGQYTVNAHFRNGLSVDSVDPVGDSLAILKMRHKLDSIRLAEKRPTVALVLGGGGAKGATEIGVIRLLEEVDMPIDLICGTSIGGLMGGLYSMGYSSDYLDSLMRSIDWSWALSDKVSYDCVPYLRKEQKANYQLSVPFHYPKEILRERAGDTSQQDVNNVSTFTSSLPSGYVSGLNVNNLLSSLTVGYQDSLNFSDLPIPFFCMSTDVVGMKAKLWSSGQLKTAMRSTMSIPALFAPVRTDGMVLVDGGTRNNFPVDLARSMGADYIIGVDLLNDNLKYAQVNNLGNLLTQFVTMLSLDSYGETIKECDIYIKPNVEGYSSLSFSNDAIDTLLRRGYEAALTQKDRIDSLKAIVGGHSPIPVRRQGVDIGSKAVQVDAIIFAGLSDYESRILQNLIGLKAGKSYNRARLEEAVSTIMSSGAVQTVSYSLIGEKEPYRLIFKCTKAPIHEFGIGVRLDSEIWAELALHLGICTRKLSGPKFEFNAKIGTSQDLSAKFMLDYPDIPTINAEIRGHFVNGDMRTLRGSYIKNIRMKVGYNSHEEKLYLSSTRWSKGSLQAGFKNSFYKIKNELLGNMFFELDSLTQSKGNYLGLFAGGDVFTFDDWYFPTRGIMLSANYNFDFVKVGVKQFSPIHTFALDLKWAIPCGDIFTIIPDFHMRNIFDNQNTAFPDWYNPDPAFSLMHRNFIGGDIAGRYVDQQVPFIGFNNVDLCMSYNVSDEEMSMVSMDQLAVVNLDLRLKAYKNLYVSALGGYVHMAPTLNDFFRKSASESIFGAAFQLSYKTIAGPIKARFMWSNRTSVAKENFGGYISMGFEF